MEDVLQITAREPQANSVNEVGDVEFMEAGEGLDNE